MTITEFLLARIDEDEAAILGVWPRPYAQHVTREDQREALIAATLDVACPTCHAEPGLGCVAMTPPHHAPRPADKQHGTRRALGRAGYRRTHGPHRQWSPARVLVECEAKRGIVRLHREWEGFGCCSTCGDVPQVEFPCDTIEALAAVYADHPDYDEAWR